MARLASVSGLAAWGALAVALGVASCKDSDDHHAEPRDIEAAGAGGEPQPASGGSQSSAAEGGAGGTQEEAAGGAPQTSVCPEPTGDGTTHGPFISKDETWSASDNPHLVPDGLSIDATLTLDPCVVVRIGAGRDVLVGGKLLAAGTTDSDGFKPVTIERLDEKNWGSIKSNSAGGEIELHSTSVSGGGAVPAGAKSQQTGMILVEGERALELEPRLTLDSVLLDGSESQGPNAR
jgi:hypothetical protein